MSESLDSWYQKELDYFRHSAGDFADRFPKIASRLSLSGNEIRDPHVERLIQAFAYLNARTRHKLDDSFPELADAMLSILYPHMVTPVPSMSIVRLGLNSSQKDLVEGYTLASGSKIETEAVRGHRCLFRTCYPVTLFPLSLDSVQLLPQPFSGPASPARSEAESALRIQLRTFDSKADLSSYRMDRLRFFIDVANFEKAARLLESVLDQALEVVITGADKSFVADVLPADCIQPVGFTREDAALPENPQTFPGYRLLTEYFVLPQKFLFFDICGITPATLEKLGNCLEITILLRQHSEELESIVSQKTIKTGCTPVINLFSRTADAVPLKYRTSEYRIVPDARAEGALEVYSIDKLTIESESKARQLRRFYSVDHARPSGDDAFWHMTRRPGPVEGDPGALNDATEVYVSLVDPAFSPQRPGNGMLYAEMTCFNRDLPEELSKQRTVRQIQLDIVGGSGPISEIECLVAPTATLRRHLGRRNLWPLISQLSLNHLSLVDSADAVASIREMLTLNDVKDSVQSRNLIDGLDSLTSEPCVQRLRGVFVRGTQVNLVLNEENFAGDSAFLFSMLLSQFFGMYASINSFTRLTTTTRLRLSRKQETWIWPAQAGDRPLI